MNRLTFDRPEGMYQALHNTAFVQNNEVWLRGLGTDNKDVPLTVYCGEQCASRCGETHMPFVPAQEFADYMDCECPVCALYIIAVGAAELRARLMLYEDAAEKETPP